MQWWNSFSEWSGSNDGWRIISGVIIPFVAIIVAGVIGALIGRGATKRVVALHEREARKAAITAIIAAARKAATWGSLGHDERAYADHLAEDADIHLRLLPVTGASVAADWANHEIADMKRNSSTFDFQAGQSLVEFRDRMLDWQTRPGRARKLFRADLERWKFESPDPDAPLIERQQAWNADQVDARRGGDAAPALVANAPAQPAPASTSTPAWTSTPPTSAVVSDPADAPSSPMSPAAVSVSPPVATPASAPAPARTPASTPSGAPAAAGSDGPPESVGTPQNSAGASPVAPASAGSDTDGAVPPADGESGMTVDGESGMTADGTSTPADTGSSAGGRTHTDTDGSDDANATDETPYGMPVSASDLRRQATDDED